MFPIVLGGKKGQRNFGYSSSDSWSLCFHGNKEFGCLALRYSVGEDVHCELCGAWLLFPFKRVKYQPRSPEPFQGWRRAPASSPQSQRQRHFWPKLPLAHHSALKTDSDTETSGAKLFRILRFWSVAHCCRQWDHPTLVQLVNADSELHKVTRSARREAARPKRRLICI